MHGLQLLRCFPLYFSNTDFPVTVFYVPSFLLPWGLSSILPWEYSSFPHSFSSPRLHGGDCVPHCNKLWPSMIISVFFYLLGHEPQECRYGLSPHWWEHLIEKHTKAFFLEWPLLGIGFSVRIRLRVSQVWRWGWGSIKGWQAKPHLQDQGPRVQAELRWALLELLGLWGPKTL